MFGYVIRDMAFKAKAEDLQEKQGQGKDLGPRPMPKKLKAKTKGYHYSDNY